MGKDEIKKNMDAYIEMLKGSNKAEGQERIYVAGEKEYISDEENSEKLSVQNKVFDILNELGKEFDLTLEGE